MIDQQQVEFNIDNEVEHVRRYLKYKEYSKNPLLPEVAKVSAFSDWMNYSTDDRYFTHVTGYKDYESNIKDEGLKVSSYNVREDESEEDKKIFCAKKINYDLKDGEVAIIFIDTEGLRKRNSGYSSGDYWIYEDVSPDNFLGVVAYDSTTYKEIFPEVLNKK